MNLNSRQAAVRSLRTRDASFFQKLDSIYVNEDCNLNPVLGWQFLDSQLKIMLSDKSWEYPALFLIIVKDYLQAKELLFRTEISQIAFENIVTLIEHDEPRVRLLATQVIRELSYIKTLEMYDTLAPLLIGRIQDLFHRTAQTRPAVLGYIKNIQLDDTTGWKSLETSVIGFKELLQGYCEISDTDNNNGVKSSSLSELFDSNRLNETIIDLLITRLSTHVNRHIRQASLDLISIIVKGLGNNLEWNYPPIPSLTSRITTAIAYGLEDNWSQVRYAASVTCRDFLHALTSDDDRVHIWPQLLPRLCLNRFYVAEGIKAHSQETWRTVMLDRGKALVAEYITHVVTYYTEMSRAPNHMVAEAACHAIAEVAAKVDREAVSPYSSSLLHALEECSSVDSWPIRDAACVASGVFVRHYPELSEASLASFFELWTTHLKDSIWSIRDNAAVALGELLASSNNHLRELALAHCLEHVEKNIDAARGEPTPEQQRAQSIQFLPPTVLQQLIAQRGSPKSTAGRIKIARADWGCCLDCVILREGRSWEASDGAVFMVRELAKTNASAAEKYLSRVWALLDVNHFKDCERLHTSVFQQLPLILKTLGKNTAKRDLADHIHRLFRAMRSETVATATAAEECSIAIAKFIGNSIFLHRVPEEMKGTFDLLLSSPDANERLNMNISNNFYNSGLPLTAVVPCLPRVPPHA